MRVFAFCAASFVNSVRRAAGVEPLTCPPTTLETFDVGTLAERDLIYFKLHGLPGEPYWYGDGWVTALSAEQIQRADLSGAVVFVANCFLPESPMLEALLSAGASVVIGGPGENYAAPDAVQGADLLGLTVRRCLQVGLNPKTALVIARRLLRWHKQDMATRDALAFQLYAPGMAQET